MTLLSLSCSRGPAFIAVALPDGRRRLIRRAATDLEQPLGPLVVEPRLCAYMLVNGGQETRVFGGEEAVLI